MQLLFHLRFAGGVTAHAAHVCRIAAFGRVAVRGAHGFGDGNLAQTRQIVALFDVGNGHAWPFTREARGETKAPATGVEADWITHFRFRTNMIGDLKGLP